MIKSSTRTVWDISLDLIRKCGISWEPKPNTTLNEKFNILTNIQNYSEYPEIKYTAIGVGGNTITDSSTGYKFNNHGAIDGALFEHIPYVMKTINEDLTPEERNEYRFRVIENIDGVEYVCYYLKKITDIDYKGVMEITTSTTGNSLSIMDTNISDILNPEPKISNDYLNTATSHVVSSIKMEYILTLSEIEELNNVLNIRYGEGNSKRISEIAICSGNDYDTGDYIEAINTQVAYFVNMDIELQSNINSGEALIRSIELGGMEPLIR
jgi:hypothetical protein